MPDHVEYVLVRPDVEGAARGLRQPGVEAVNRVAPRAHYCIDARTRDFHPAITTYHPTAGFRGHDATLHVIERYTRTARDEMHDEVTVDDPGTFERPYTAVLDLTPQGGIFEYACHEGNRGLANILSAARAEELVPPSSRGGPLLLEAR